MARLYGKPHCSTGDKHCSDYAKECKSWIFAIALKMKPFARSCERGLRRMLHRPTLRSMIRSWKTAWRSGNVATNGIDGCMPQVGWALVGLKSTADVGPPCHKV